MIAFFLVFNRAFLGTTFALSFFAKARHFASFVATLHAFRLLPTPVVKPAAALILAAELAILLLLGSELLLPVGFTIAFWLLLLFTGALAVVLYRGEAASCNCFGATETPISMTDLVRNGGLLLVTGLGWLAAASTVSPGWDERLLLALMGIVYGLLWSHLSECGRLLHDIRQASRQEGSG